MNWEDERYVRVYIRDTVTWKVLPWQGRCLLPLLLRKADRAGCVDISGAGAEGVAALVDIPLEVAQPGLEALFLRGVVQQRDDVLVFPKFIKAQEAMQSDKLRQQISRERRRAQAMLEVSSVTQRDDLSHGVTECHAVSRDVTPNLAVPNLTKLKKEFFEEFVVICGSKWGLPEKQAALVAGQGLWLPNPHNGFLLEGMRAARAAGHTDDDLRRLARWVAAGGLDWQGKSCWAHVAKHFLPCLSQALGWDGVSDPRRKPSARAPQAHSDNSMVHPDDLKRMRGEK